MAERLVLDPTEEAAGRSQFDLTPWVAQEGPDWGEGVIQAYMAEQSRGATPVDFRVGTRQVEIPLNLQARGGTSFATARALVQAKASLFQREGGKGKRITTAGSVVYFDIVNASLKLGGGWLQSAKDVDLDATLSLECLPDFYEAEVQLADHTETSLSELVFTETTVRGDYPARVRVVVDEDQGQSQLGLIWSFRNRHYSSAATAATRFEAEALNPLDTAARAALSGASGGTVVTHGTLSTNWTPVLDTRIGGTAYMTQTGTNRLWVRYRTTSGTAVQLRAVWDVGDLVFPVENTPVRCNAGTEFFVADLGELRLDPSPVGTHRWQGMIQARGAVGAENVSIDRVWVLNADEGYGYLTAASSPAEGLSAYNDRDEFNQVTGALAAKVSSGGKTWAGAGDATDYAVNDVPHTLERTAVSDVDVNTGRYAVSGAAAFAAQAVQVDAKWTVGGSDQGLFGVLARYVDTSNWLMATLSPPTAAAIAAGTPETTLRVRKRVTGTVTDLVSRSLSLATSATYYTVRLFVDAGGRYFVWVYRAGSQPGDLLLAGQDTVLATGGALASGKPGIYDAYTPATASTRTYDGFATWAPVSDAVVYASQSAELRSDGIVREDIGGTAWGPVVPIGDLPRLPPTVEGRTTEVFVKASRGDLGLLPDTGIDDISARVTYRPCWLTVPGS